MLKSSLGTLFAPVTINSAADVRAFIRELAYGFAGNTSAQNNFIDKVLAEYPDDPAQGSPFGTGNETFGRSVSWKRAAAIIGDVYFHSTRREWINGASKVGVKTFGFHFTDPQLGNLGGWRTVTLYKDVLTPHSLSRV